MTDIVLPRQRCPVEYRDAEISPAIKGHAGWQSMLLIGPAGTGKTSQVWALQRKYVRGDESHGFHRVHVISECSDIDRRRYEWDWLETWAQFGRAYDGHDGVLCVDDIGYRKPNEWTVQAIYHLATYRRAHGLRTIWTTNLDMDRLAEQYSPAIASRLAGGVVINTGGEDRRQQAQG